MVLTDDEWTDADPATGVITQVSEVLDEDDRAYCVEDFFRDAGPEGSEEFEPLNAVMEALNWQTSRNRSELLVEVALETLVADGDAEKRVRTEDDGTVGYYRAA